MEISKICLASIASFTISSCGIFKDSNDPTLRTLASSFEIIFESEIAKQDPPNIRKILEGAFLNNLEEPALFAEMDNGQAAVLTKFPGENIYETWITKDGVTISFENQRVKSTRGLGFDVMLNYNDSSKINQRSEVKYSQIMTWLTEDNQIISETFQCRGGPSKDNALSPILAYSLTSQTVREVCKSPKFSFENIFIFNSLGKATHSYQFISPEVGSIYLEFL